MENAPRLFVDALNVLDCKICYFVDGSEGGDGGVTISTMLVGAGIFVSSRDVGVTPAGVSIGAGWLGTIVARSPQSDNNADAPKKGC